MNIELLADQRSLLSQNVLSQLRNLVEGIAVLVHTNSPNSEFSYTVVGAGLAFVKSKARLNFLSKFHKLIQKSASHYTLDGDTSERLMLKYYEYLYRIRTFLKINFGFDVLVNLEDFPVDLDPSLREYHEKIAAKIDMVNSTASNGRTPDRYYIQKTRPFFVNGRVYYEITFCRAINRVSKFDRIIAFTNIEITDKYAAMLSLQRNAIEVLGQTMPIMIIQEWSVSIRPCEFINFARLLDIDLTTRSNSKEYHYLMRGLTSGLGNLIDLMDMSDKDFARVKKASAPGVTNPQLFLVLDAARKIIESALPGANVIRYLMLRMHNQTLKPPFSKEHCVRLSDLNLQYGCIPFDTMPFCTSLPLHNPRYWDLVESLNVSGRNHELLARHIKNNVERHGVLYTPMAELGEFGDVNDLVEKYNNELYYKHKERRILLDNGHVFISGYENDTVSIVKMLQGYASSGVAGYGQAVERWLDEGPTMIDDSVKRDAIVQLFCQSRIALVYGAAGTGKSTMVDHIAHYFNDKEKLFLAYTNPAVDNLKRKVTAQNSTFRTISSQVNRRNIDPDFDILIIDECSTVSNTDLIKVLNGVSFKLLVLVGDIYQIESIQFGNWFKIISSFIPATSVFELTTPFRTKNDKLLDFWNKVRNISDDLAEVLAHNGYSTVLDKTLFEKRGKDEITLCLNYDGLYGINNINRFLQSSNPEKAIIWRESTYKVGDPILFYDSERFRPVIYNNLKGQIVGIEHDRGWIKFDIKLDRPLTEFDVDSVELEWIGGSTVRFTVYEDDRSDEDDDSLNTSVPFQVAYAVSIHKAQGLEYDSVKIVITDANEDNITHNIFYTAVTRARETLRIYWTPETQQRVLKRLSKNCNRKDVSLLVGRRDLTPTRD